MGLALEVGVLADLKGTDDKASVFGLHGEQFEIINKAVRADGLGEHIEPQEPNETFSCGMLGYSGPHYLRRIAAHLALGKPIPPRHKHADKDPLVYGEYCSRHCPSQAHALPTVPGTMAIRTGDHSLLAVFRGAPGAVGALLGLVVAARGEVLMRFDRQVWRRQGR
jgi:hypothetical protein